MCVGLSVNKELIGNMMIYIAEKSKMIYHTKLLKLIYLIDERSTIETGAPITWLEYKAWNYGPVSEDIYFSKNQGYNKFSEYVRFEQRGSSFLVVPTKEYNSSVLSEQDIDIIDSILSQYGKMTAQQLIDITHKKGSLWSKEVKKNNIKFTEENKTSDFIINFVDLIDDDPFKKTIYFSTFENIELAATLS